LTSKVQIDSSTEIKRLQGCLNDLISVMAVPALWTGRDPTQIVKTLLDVLVGMLRLDFAYARTSNSVDGSPIELLRVVHRQTPLAQPHEVGRALNDWLTDDLPTSPLTVPNPIGDGEITIAVLRLGLQDEIGVLVAASQRKEFPTEVDMLLLRVAANQAAIGLQEARVLSEQKRSAEKLEKRVAERTRQLTVVNAELIKEITEREHVEEEQRKFASLVEHSTDFIGIASPDGRVLFVNPAGQKMVGLSDDGPVGATMMIDYVMEQERQRFQDQVLPAVLRDGHWEGKMLIRHFKTGAPIPMLHNVFVIKESGNDRGLALATIGRDITERQRSERLLRKANERVEMVLDSITDKFFGFDKKWRYTYFNKQAEEQIRTLGKDPGDLIGKVLWKEYPHPASEEAFRRAMRERTVVTEEHYYPPLGEWVENRIYPSADGGVAIFQRYVTQRKQAEKSLLESERKFSIMFNKAAFAITLTRLPKGFIVDVNEAWVKLFGFTRGQAVGKTTLELGINRDPEGRARLFAELQERGSVRNVEMTFFTKSGEARLLSRNIDVVGIGGDNYLLSTINDITERRHAEEELRRSETYLAEGQRLSHTGSWSWNASSGELYWSREHFRICGLDPDKEKPTYPEMDVIHPQDRSFVEETFEKAIRERSHFELKCRVVHKDATIRYVHSLAHPVFNQSGELTEYVGTIMDITESKQAEQTLQKAQADLAHVTRVSTLGELTASIAHELNQPLGAIVTNGNASLRLLARESPDLDGGREAIECMISDALRASEVIKRIRTLLRKATSEMTPLNMNETIRQVLPLAASELVRNQVSLTTDLAEDLAPLLGDRVQLQQVLLNLILNGSEAMSEPGWQPREMLITSRNNKPAELMVSVRDSGVGLDPRNPDRIFDAFVSTKEGGVGLGLSISRTIIEAHGGKLWATQNKGPGATFRFTLPATWQ
jgi:PAS domain S-box-containing protein